MSDPIHPQDRPVSGPEGPPETTAAEPPPAYGQPTAPAPGPPPPPPGQPQWGAPGQPYQGMPPGPPQGWTGPPPGPYGAGPQYGGVRPATDAEAKQIAGLAHFLGLGVLFWVNWLGPLIVYLLKRDAHPFIRDQSAESLNFNVSMFLYMIPLWILAGLLWWLFVPVLLLLAAIAVNVVLSVIAGQRASSGEAYRYPLTIRMIT